MQTPASTARSIFSQSANGFIHGILLFLLGAAGSSVIVLTASTSTRVLLLGIALAALLFLLSRTDIEQGRLPDRMTIPLAGVGLTSAIIVGRPDLFDGLIGASLGGVFGIAIAYGYHAIRQRPGLGGGDIKLLAAGGMWVGWQGLPILLFAASTTALIVCAGSARLSRTDRLAFGPYLALALWMVWTVQTMPLVSLP